MCSGLRLLIALFLSLVVRPALAHPHVWVVAKAELVFAPDGKLAAVRHAWTFDEMTSASWLEGLAPAGQTPPPNKLAEHVDGMKEYIAASEYFTNLKANGSRPGFGDWRDARMDVEKGLVTLRFELPLKVPAPANRQVVFSVSDPTFFVEFQTATGPDAVTLDGAPKGCVVNVLRAKLEQPKPGLPIGENLFKTLAEASALSAQFAGRSTVVCP